MEIVHGVILVCEVNFSRFYRAPKDFLMMIQPAQQECHACCLPPSGKTLIQLVVVNLHDAHVERGASSFPKILQGL